MDEAILDVASTPDAAVETVADSSSAVVETSGESQGGVTATDGSATSTEVETQGETDPLKDIPTLEELQAQVAQKVPYAQALAQLRPAYEIAKSQLESYKPLEPWKGLAETIGDPAIVQSAYDLVSSIHTPDATSTSGFSARPFLERIEAESPGTLDQIFVDILPIPITTADGQQSTVVMELIKSWGLDPNRLDDYRNIDTLRASGVITADDLAQIPDKYHDTFRAMSESAREDLIDLIKSKPLVADEMLRNAQDALEARQYRERDEQARQQAAQEAQQQFERDVTQAQEQDISGRIQFLHDSVHQGLKSHAFSSDPTINALEHSKILGILANLHNPFPVYRQMAEQTLKTAGVDITGYYDLVNVYEQERAKFVRYDKMGDQMQAPRAKAAATQAEQRILTKLNAWAGVLAKASGNRAAEAAAAQEGALATASARFIPNGNGTAQQGAQNPYAANPHPFNSPEYRVWNKKMDVEVGLTKAQMFGGN